MPATTTVKSFLLFLLAVALSVGAYFFLAHPGKERRTPARVQLYYYNETADREIAPHLPCSPDAVLPVERTLSRKDSLIFDTISLLLEGKLTPEEIRQGFRTDLPDPGFKLKKAELKSGILTLSFEDKNNFASGGACRVTILKTQIEKTAGQFPQVMHVLLAPPEAFQP